MSNENHKKIQIKNALRRSKSSCAFDKKAYSEAQAQNKNQAQHFSKKNGRFSKLITEQNLLE